MYQPIFISPEELRIRQILAIAHATEHLISGLTGHTAADIDAGIEKALDLFINDNASPGNAVPRGAAYASRRITQRRELDLYCQAA